MTERLSKELYKEALKDLEFNFGKEAMDLSEGKVDLWWRRFRFLTDKDFDVMVYNAIEYCKYPPNMAMLLDMRDPSASMQTPREIYPERYLNKEQE